MRAGHLLCVPVYVCMCHIWSTVDINICTHLLSLWWQWLRDKAWWCYVCPSGRSMAVSRLCATYLAFTQLRCSTSGIVCMHSIISRQHSMPTKYAHTCGICFECEWIAGCQGRWNFLKHSWAPSHIQMRDVRLPLSNFQKGCYSEVLPKDICSCESFIQTVILFPPGMGRVGES